MAIASAALLIAKIVEVPLIKDKETDSNCEESEYISSYHNFHKNLNKYLNKNFNFISTSKMDD
ncbi:hypothetical protein pdam_00014918 [Pocillopora damicornis]|uniref:Uncharacterized protein n=1 Tax=Pocillopora damicornis TaxID=46731 RepID=A0A3M6US63_POCDA|nr:hypothetical protein pdam_00014918 [Pocillopora damicornis]